MDDKVDDGHCWYRSSKNDLEGGFEFGFGLEFVWNLYVSGNNLLGFFFCFLVRVKMFNREDFICLE